MKDQDEQFLADYWKRLVTSGEISRARMPDIAAIRDLWHAAKNAGNKVIFLGNGGSAGIASHMAIDLSKNGRLAAMCFDVATVTCLANDRGHENWMASALEIWARPGDVVIAISSSGRSKNVLNAADFAVAHQLELVTLSGMAPDNPLREKGKVNLWCDSRAYNIIETAHQFWLMAAIDLLIGKAEYAA
jgi:phosphoheptose isomerase